MYFNVWYLWAGFLHLQNDRTAEGESLGLMVIYNVSLNSAFRPFKLTFFIYYFCI